ncbi:MAG: alpha/beta fold hydrolase [Solirubrobacterales bacterium]|nr:alpha/beta fold hydrolase [Solirubrobacterales bacterium]
MSSSPSSVALSGDVELYYESTGAGAPVLLVMGLGMNATGWWRTVPVLVAAGFRVLSFDNRGMGRSARPPGPYSVGQLADDCVAVLDAAGEQSAHVYGISLGGMIAQEVALRHPARVRSLVLGATTPGGQRSVALGSDVRAFFDRRAAMPPEESVWASVPYNYGPRTRAEDAQRIGEDIARRLRFPAEPEYYLAQLAAALSHDAHARLPELTVPTLVVHGDADVMVPPGNAELLAEAIPGARLELLPGAGHLYPTDEPAADVRVAEFLVSVRSTPGRA